MALRIGFPVPLPQSYPMLPPRVATPALLAYLGVDTAALIGIKHPKHP